MISQQDFVLAYNSSANTEEVSAKTGLSIGAIYSRAAHYRKQGVRLKSLASVAGRQRLDVEGLNALLERQERGEVDFVPPGGATKANGATRKKRPRKKKEKAPA